MEDFYWMVRGDDPEDQFDPESVYDMFSFRSILVFFTSQSVLTILLIFSIEHVVVYPGCLPDLKTTVAKLSHVLNTHLNIAKNDVVLIFAPNSIQYPVCLYSVIALGAVATTVNPQYTVGELSKQIKDSNPKVIIIVQELYSKVEHFGLPVVFLGSGVSRKRCFLYKDLILKSGVSELPKVSIQGDDTATLLYSSRTTGVSNGGVMVKMSTESWFTSVKKMTTADRSSCSRPTVELSLGRRYRCRGKRIEHNGRKRRIKGTCSGRTVKCTFLLPKN